MRSGLGHVAGLVVVVAVAAAAIAPAHAESFVHPRHHYALSIPAGASIASPLDADELVIHSWAGFIVSLRAVAAGREDTVDDLVARVEDRYLGAGKSWTRKVAGAPARLAGLPAYAAEYEGATGRVRTLVARGRRTAFEIMFFAQPADYAALVGIFENLLTSFRPGPQDRAAESRPPQSPPHSAEPPSPKPATSRAAGPTVSAGPPPAPPARRAQRSPAEDQGMAAHRFQEPGLGFTIGYPAHWKLERPYGNAVVFHSDDPESRATVSVQNVGSAANDAGNRSALAVAENLKTRLGVETRDVSYMGDGPVVYRRDGLDLDGHQFLARYGFDGQVFKQLTVILVRPDGAIAHIWSYRALDSRFDDHRPIATEMLKSWSITPPTAADEKDGT